MLLGTAHLAATVQWLTDPAQLAACKVQHNRMTLQQQPLWLLLPLVLLLVTLHAPALLLLHLLV
jgi:hypothetical protein